MALNSRMFWPINMQAASCSPVRRSAARDFQGSLSGNGGPEKAYPVQANRRLKGRGGGIRQWEGIRLGLNYLPADLRGWAFGTTGGRAGGVNFSSTWARSLLEQGRFHIRDKKRAHSGTRPAGFGNWAGARDRLFTHQLTQASAMFWARDALCGLCAGEGFSRG